MMTIKEAKRLGIVQEVREKRLTQQTASKQLSLSLRQTQRLIRKYCQEGETGLISKRRGKPSPNKINMKKKKNILSLIRKKYVDFGPTLASEKLNEINYIKISRETLRKWMIEEHLWQPKKKKEKRVYQRRKRRSCFGELVQTDGSYHPWFEDRGEKCCLIIFVDDATSLITQGYFCQSETTENYFFSMENYFKQYGKPLAMYTDRHSIFKDNISKLDLNKTQFGRVLKTLDIELICANSPQAKGRVERTFGVLQDRWVKEMRLQNINSIEEANAYLPTLIAKHNKQFGKHAQSVENVHRSLEATEIEQIAFVDHRKLSKNLTLQYQHVLYQIQTKTPNRMQHAQVDIIRRYQAPIRIEYQGKELDYTIWQDSPPWGAVPQVLDHKQIESICLDKTRKPKKNHPWR